VGEIAENLSTRTLALENPGAQAAGCFVCDIMSRTIEKGFRGIRDFRLLLERRSEAEDE